MEIPDWGIPAGIDRCRAEASEIRRGRGTEGLINGWHDHLTESIDLVGKLDVGVGSVVSVAARVGSAAAMCRSAISAATRAATQKATPFFFFLFSFSFSFLFIFFKRFNPIWSQLQRLGYWNDLKNWPESSGIDRNRPESTGIHRHFNSWRLNKT